MTLSFSVFCNFQTCMSIRRPLKCSAPILCTTSSTCLRMWQFTWESGFWCGRLDGLASTLGDPLERRVSFMLTTMLVAAVGGNRTLLQRFPGRVGSRPRFFGEKHSPASACSTLQPRASLDELLLVTRLAPLLQTIWRAELCEELYATGASPDGVIEVAEIFHRNRSRCHKFVN